MARERHLVMACALTLATGCPAENIFHESGSSSSDGTSGGSAPTTTIAPTTTDAATTTTDPSGDPTTDPSAGSTTDSSEGSSSPSTSTDDSSSSDTGEPLDLDGWTKRRLITITNDLPDDLEDFQVLIPVEGDSDMQSDFADLRFANENVTAAIPYWIEWATEPVEAAVWVRVPAIPANDSIDIWMYYGNDAATSESDGAATMIFADDFESDAFDGTVWEASGDYEVTNGALTLMTGSIYTIDPVLSPGTLLQARMRYSCCEPSLGSGLFMSAFAQGDSYLYDYAAFQDVALHLHYAAGATGGPNDGSSLGIFNYDLWTDFGIGRTVGQVHFRRWTFLPATTSYGANLEDDHYIVLGDYHGSTAGTVDMTNMNYDAIFVRTFATLEPTVEMANEEDAP